MTFNTYRIRNWSTFQHYKDRSPPWIKLHWELLASEDWVMLADDSRLLMIVCMMIASRNDGTIKDNPAYIKRVAYLDHEPDLRPLISCGFLEKVQADDSALQADASMTQADAIPEKRREESEHKDSAANAPCPVLKEVQEKPTPEGFDAFWEAYPRKVAKKAAKKAFAKAIKTVSIEEILIGISRYKKHKPSYADWAHPTTWLNHERWADDYTDPKKRNVPDHFNPADWNIGVGNA